MLPVAASRLSTRVVFPDPEWPTNTTLRIAPGWSAIGALPLAAGPPLDFSAIAGLLELIAHRAAVSVCGHDSPVPRWPGQAPTTVTIQTGQRHWRRDGNRCSTCT